MNKLSVKELLLLIKMEFDYDNTIDIEDGFDFYSLTNQPNDNYSFVLTDESSLEFRDCEYWFVFSLTNKNSGEVVYLKFEAESVGDVVRFRKLPKIVSPIEKTIIVYE